MITTDTSSGVSGVSAKGLSRTVGLIASIARVRT